MTVRAVEAVFFARYSISNFRALYGRLPADNQATYTKDFLQVLQAAGDALAPTLGADRETDLDIEYEWPTGTCPGKFRWREPRWQLRWFTQQKPLPWTVGDIAEEAVSIPGDSSLQDPTEADAVHNKIVESGTEPWFIAVKLAGEPRKLHVRTYFRSPTPQFADRALANLPVLVQEAIGRLPGGDGSGTVVLPPVAEVGVRRTPRAEQLVAKIRDTLKREPNILLVGPPGTGKTVALEELQAIYGGRMPAGTILFDTTVWGEAWSTEGGLESRSEVLVFHPSYSYENFVAGLYPTSNGQGISLEAKPGPLLCLSHWASKGNREALLIIDEFNRGAAAAIFGDCLSLLDKDKRASASNRGAMISRPYIGQSMPLPATYWEDKSSIEYVEDEIRLPEGVHIVAAMNSTDRSVAPLDAAMRRRFAVIKVGPDYDALATNLGLSLEGYPQQRLPSTAFNGWGVADVSLLAVRVLQALNNRIEFCLGEDFLLGHALLWHITADAPEERLTQFAQLVDAKVIPTLRMTFLDQDDALAAILAVPSDVRVAHGGVAPAGKFAYWKEAPPALAAINEKRLFISSLSLMNSQEQIHALTALLD